MWAAVKLLTKPHQAAPFSSQCSVSQVPWHKQEPYPDAAPPFHQGFSLVCRETVSQRRIPQETAVCPHPWLKEVMWHRLTAQPFPLEIRHCCGTSVNQDWVKWDLYPNPASSFSHGSWKTVVSCLTRKAEHYLVLTILPILIVSQLLNKVVGQRILQKPSGCLFQQQIKRAAIFLPISQSQYLLILADWFWAWKDSFCF